MTITNLRLPSGIIICHLKSFKTNKKVRTRQGCRAEKGGSLRGRHWGGVKPKPKCKTWLFPGPSTEALTARHADYGGRRGGKKCHGREGKGREGGIWDRGQRARGKGNPGKKATARGTASFVNLFAFPGAVLAIISGASQQTTHTDKPRHSEKWGWG